MDLNYVPPTIKTEKPYLGKRINVRLDWVDCNLEDLILREVIEHPGAVVIVAYSQEKKIPLVNQYRHAINCTTFECPAGTRELNEDSLITAKRELAEEAKLAASEWSSLGYIYAAPGISNEKQNLYFASGLSNVSANTDPGEYVEVVWFSLDEIKKMIREYIIIDSKTISAIYRADLLGFFN